MKDPGESLTMLSPFLLALSMPVCSIQRNQKYQHGRCGIIVFLLRLENLQGARYSPEILGLKTFTEIAPIFTFSDAGAPNKLKIPKNDEVGRIDLRKLNTDASTILIDTKKKHAEKMKRLKEKMEQLHREQKDLELNLTKFNTFVKEKQLKVERGIQTEKEEKELREKMTNDIEQKEVVLVELTYARVRVGEGCVRFRAICSETVSFIFKKCAQSFQLMLFFPDYPIPLIVPLFQEFLEEAVKKRKMFHDFLHTVVDSEASRSRYLPT